LRDYPWAITFPETAREKTLSHIGPDPRLPFAGKVLFWLFWIVGMALIAIFIAPLVAEYISTPFSQWVGSFFD
jgi:hypothetical protein